ncbi:hypothetical protein T296_11365 [Pantoea agglomerans Eh318]|nr:hypothetical protein T296_11365 [Pantoea agglomerans Eh318]
MRLLQVKYFFVLEDKLITEAGQKAAASADDKKGWQTAGYLVTP